MTATAACLVLHVVQRCSDGPKKLQAQGFFDVFDALADGEVWHFIDQMGADDGKCQLSEIMLYMCTHAQHWFQVRDPFSLVSGERSFFFFFGFRCEILNRLPPSR